MEIELKSSEQIEKMTDHEIVEYIKNLEIHIQKIHKKRSPEYYESNYVLGLASGIIADRYNGEAEMYCKKGISAFIEVLKIIRKDDLARQALIQRNLGNIYCIFAQHQNDVKFCHISIQYHKKGLRNLKISPENFAEAIADIHFNLGNTYVVLAKYEKREKNCDLAIDCFQKALIKKTPDKSPKGYASIQNSLGNAYQLLASVRDGSDNYKLAIAAYEEALRFVDPIQSSDLYRVIYRNHQTLLNRTKMNWLENKTKNLGKQDREFLSPIYEKYYTIDEGGYGVVDLVINNETNQILALKTFRDVFLDKLKERTLFNQEAEKWINLGKHPYIVQAYFFEIINGRPYIAMEFIPPSENGCCSLKDFISKSSITEEQIAVWGIQFCIGMEYVYAHGISCHRDIKPSNILITPENTLKITDFGLAKVIESNNNGKSQISENTQTEAFPEYTNPIGTTLYRSPEHILSPSECDERSDIFSFGIVLYEMVSNGGHPFILPFDNSSSDDEYHPGNIIPIQRDIPIPDLNSPFNRIIHKCLMFQPNERYQQFKEIRDDLQRIYKKITGKEFVPLSVGEWQFEDLGNKGISYDHFGKYNEALKYYDEVISIIPKNKMVWANKAFSLNRLSRYADAIVCCDTAIAIDPVFSVAYLNKGNALQGLGKFQEAIICYNQALEIKPWFVEVLHDKAMCLISLEKYNESIECCNTAIEINPKYPNAYKCKGNALLRLERYQDAIENFDNAINIDSRDKNAWNTKAIAFAHLKDFQSALVCAEKSLEIDNKYCDAYLTKSTTLLRMGKKEEAIEPLNQLLQIDPLYQIAWKQKGIVLEKLGLYKESIDCLNKVLEIEPTDTSSLGQKGVILGKLGLYEESIYCFDKVLEYNPINIKSLKNKLISIKALGNQFSINTLTVEMYEW
jgi:tetratricopeptide (TPR) repeat protein